MQSSPEPHPGHMQILLIILFLVLGLPSNAQTNKSVAIPVYKNSLNQNDTSSWYSWTTEIRQASQLTDLLQSNDSFHFRLWTDKQAVDIWTQNTSRCYGTITNFAKRLDAKLHRKGIYKVDKIYSMQISLDSSIAKMVFEFIRKNDICSIPTDGDVKGWSQGFDGEEFLVECSSPRNYEFKTYWTPRAFTDSLAEARKMQSFIQKLFVELNFAGYFRKLKLPAGYYSWNGIPGIEIRVYNYGEITGPFIWDNL
jgi:hypothetical protein